MIYELDYKKRCSVKNPALHPAEPLPSVGLPHRENKKKSLAQNSRFLGRGGFCGAMYIPPHTFVPEEHIRTAVISDNNLHRVIPHEP